MNQATPKPLPETTPTCLGPGHIDIVYERINQAIGIGTTVHSTIRNSDSDGDDVQTGAEQACLGQIRLLEEAGEHLAEHQREQLAIWHQANQPRPAPVAAAASVPASTKPASEFTRQTAPLSDAADETEAATRELLAVLEVANSGDMDSDTARDAVRAFATLARSAYERARDAARMAEELHESNRGLES